MNASAQIFVFEVGGKRYAFPVDYVKEVVAMPQYTPVPVSPDHVLGLASYKNGVLPLFSLEKIFDINKASASKLCLIVYSRQGLIGYGVDAVAGVHPLSNVHQIEAGIRTLSGALKIISTLQLGLEASPVIMLDN